MHEGSLSLFSFDAPSPRAPPPGGQTGGTSGAPPEALVQPRVRGRLEGAASAAPARSARRLLHCLPRSSYAAGTVGRPRGDRALRSARLASVSHSNARFAVGEA